MKKLAIDTRKDMLLLLLYTPDKNGSFNEKIVGRTRLVKMMYLFKREALEHFKKGTDVNEGNFYTFFPWNYGPFSTEVYDDITFFLLRGFIESNIADEDALPESAAEWELWVNSTDDSSENELFQVFQEEAFTLTGKGVTFTEKLWGLLTNQQHSLLIEFKARLSKAPLRAILRYVYERYEEMTTRSQIKDDILHKSL